MQQLEHHKLAQPQHPQKKALSIIITKDTNQEVTHLTTKTTIHPYPDDREIQLDGKGDEQIDIGKS